MTAFCLVLLYRPLFEGRVLFQRDISMWLYPQSEAFVRSISAGSWPVWDDCRGFGQPLLADPSAEVLYPITWLNLVMKPWTFYRYSVLFHLVFSGLGLGLLARRWHASPIGAGLGACAWVGSGPLLSLAALPHHMVGAAFVPWVFLAADAALDRRSLGTALLWAAAMTGQILAGSADMVAMTGVTLTAYVLSRHVRWRPGEQRANVALVWTGLLALAVALGLSAAQWLPTLEVAARSTRWQLPAEERMTWSLHPLRLLEVALRFRWNELPLRPALMASILDLREPWLRSLYAGAPAFALVAGAIAVPGLPRRRFLVGVAFAAAFVSLGRHAVAYELIVFLLPPLRMLRFPEKAMLVVAFAGSLLAAMGWDAWRDADRAPVRRWRGVVVLLAILALGAAGAAYAAGPGAERWGPFLVALDAGRPSYRALLAPVASRLAVGALTAAVALALALLRRWRIGPVAHTLAVLLVADLLLAHADFHPSAPKDLFTHRPEALGKVEPPPEGRVYVYDYSVATPEQRTTRSQMANAYRLARMPEAWSYPEALVLGVQMYLNPPTNGRWGLAGSYDLDLLGLESASLTELKRHLRRAEGTPAHLRLLQIGGVRNVLALDPAEWWKDLTPVAVISGLFARPIHIFAVPDPLPRAYVVGRALVTDEGRAIDPLVDPSFDPWRAVLLDPGPLVGGARAFKGTSRITLRKPDRVVLEADLSAPGYLVLVDGYDPGWRAAVDGIPTLVRRANVAFRAVAVPSGHHVIEFAYRPRALALGLTVSLGTISVVLLAASWRKRSLRG